jgi:hypothetical protein
MSVQDALGRWAQIMTSTPNGQPVETNVEGASPGAGASMAVSMLYRPDHSAAALVIIAGTYDGEPRIFARVFEGGTNEVSAAFRQWRDEVRR